MDQYARGDGTAWGVYPPATAAAFPLLNSRCIAPWADPVVMQAVPGNDIGGAGLAADPDYFRSDVPVSCHSLQPECLTVELYEFKPRMQWWMLAEGQQVFSLGLSRAPEKNDQTVYPINSSRYTIETADKELHPHPHTGETLGFDWHICLDGLAFRLDGGRREVDMTGPAGRACRRTMRDYSFWDILAEARWPWVRHETPNDMAATVLHPSVQFLESSTCDGVLFGDNLAFRAVFMVVEESCQGV